MLGAALLDQATDAPREAPDHGGKALLAVIDGCCANT
jgi:hypothetical protein